VLLDFIAGPGIARVLAGHPVDEAWREQALELWWRLARAGEGAREQRAAG
jgi:hypothetical protein